MRPQPIRAMGGSAEIPSYSTPKNMNPKEMQELIEMMKGLFGGDKYSPSSFMMGLEAIPKVERPETMQAMIDPYAMQGQRSGGK